MQGERVGDEQEGLALSHASDPHLLRSYPDPEAHGGGKDQVRQQGGLRDQPRGPHVLGGTRPVEISESPVPLSALKQADAYGVRILAFPPALAEGRVRNRL